MKKEGYYSTGEFMKLAHITKKTVRYYDEKGILKPSFVTETGARFYSDDDFAKLQQILLLKYIGFSLKDIKELTINDADYHFMENSLNLQLKLVEDKIEQLQLVAQTIKDTTETIHKKKNVDWSQMLELIHLTVMEKKLKNQYQNASNISARINLHKLYSVNKEGWFPWIFRQCEFKDNMRVLEIGCGDGAFWKMNRRRIPKGLEIVLSDISEGMLGDVRRTIGTKDSRFTFAEFDCEKIPYKAGSFDIVIANHVLFYCDDIGQACSEIKRVLKKGGVLICGTYGENHMKEVSRLVSDFDNRIVLAAKNLYERFGKENGGDILSKYFAKTQWLQYEDALDVKEPEPLISYVLSCHGNQNQYILERFDDFRKFVAKKVEEGIVITKDAGIFVCRK